MTRKGNLLPPKGVRPDPPPPPPKNWRKIMKECSLLGGKEVLRTLTEVVTDKEALKILGNTVEDQQKRITELVGVLDSLSQVSNTLIVYASSEVDPVIKAATDLLNTEGRERKKVGTLEERLVEEREVRRELARALDVSVAIMHMDLPDDSEPSYIKKNRIVPDYITKAEAVLVRARELEENIDNKE